VWSTRNEPVERYITQTHEETHDESHKADIVFLFSRSMGRGLYVMLNAECYSYAARFVFIMVPAHHPIPRSAGEFRGTRTTLRTGVCHTNRIPYVQCLSYAKYLLRQ
jgi:hypothetical protein